MGEAAPVRRYLICAIPRSGSNWLCQLLQRTGAAGLELEERNSEPLGTAADVLDARTDWSREDATSILRKTLEGSRTPNGVEGFKIMLPHWQRLSRLGTGSRVKSGLTQEEFEAELRALDCIVFIRRRDLVGQAISWSKALQNWAWTSLTPAGPSSNLRYSYPFILNRMREIRSLEAGWRKLFARVGVEPVEVVYEDLVRDPDLIVGEISQRLFGQSPGLENRCRVRRQPDTLQRQANEQTERWRQRFERDHRTPLTRMLALGRSALEPLTWQRASLLIPGRAKKAKQWAAARRRYFRKAAGDVKAKQD